MFRQSFGVSRFTTQVLLLAGVGFAYARAAAAHEKWFVSAATQGGISPFFRTPAAAPLAFVAVMTLVVGLLVWRGRRLQNRVPLPRAIAVWMPTIVGVAVGISMLAAALERTVFAPNLHIPDGVFGSWVVVFQSVIALALIFGLGARAASLGILLLSVLSVVWFGWDAFDYLNMIGIGIFLFVWGRGAWSAGALFGKVFFAFDMSPFRAIAFLVLRVLFGVTLCVLGIEKILHPDMHMAVLALFPTHNPYTFYHGFLSFLTPDWYLLISAVVEIGAGVLLACGVLLRQLSLFLLIPFLLYPFFFGAGELLGHLPIIATLFACALAGSYDVARER